MQLCLVDVWHCRSPQIVGIDLPLVMIELLELGLAGPSVQGFIFLLKERKRERGQVVMKRSFVGKTSI